MPKRFYIITSLILLVIGYAQAQSITRISGKVTDEQGAAVIGANVYLLDSYDGTTSLDGGAFSFETRLADAHTLVVSYLGYKDRNIPVLLEGRPLELTISLSANALELTGVEITAGVYEAGGENRREVLRPLDIVSTAGATADLAGVFNTLPGTQAVGEEGRLFVRGGEEYESKTFIDGMQVNHFYSPAAPNTPSRSRFLPFMFSGASFSTGGYSAEFGQALSSALILQSKPVATTDRIDVSLLSVGADAGFTKAWAHSSLSGKLQYTNIDPYFSLIDQEIDWVDPPTSGEGSFAYRKNLGQTGIFKLYGVGAYSSLTLNHYLPGRADEPVLTDIRNRYAYLNAVLHDEIQNDWRLKTGLSLTGNLDRLGIERQQMDQSEIALHGKVVLEKDLANGFDIKMGGEYFLTTAEQELSGPAAAAGRSLDYTDHLPVLFAESDIRLAEKWLARIGIRSAYATLNRQAHVAPRISLAYKTGEASQLSAAFGTFQQAPVAEFLLQDQRLRHEQAVHYILNYQLSREDRTFRVEAYYKDYDRLVRFQTGTGGARTGLTNTGRGYARGIDLFWRDSRTIRGVDYWLSYSFLDTRRYYRDFPHFATPGFASRHNFSIVYKHFIPVIRSQVGATARYASGRPYHDPNLAGFYNQTTKEYLDLSLNLSYLVSQQIILHVSATNIPGRDNVFGYEFASAPNEAGVFESRPIRPPARRFLFAGLFVTFSKENTFNQLPNL